MRFLRSPFLLAWLATILIVAISSQAEAQPWALAVDPCASEHQHGNDHDQAPQDDSPCPCVCHFLHPAMVQWSATTLRPVALTAMVPESPQSIVEAPRAPIDYPPQLA